MCTIQGVSGYPGKENGDCEEMEVSDSSSTLTGDGSDNDSPTVTPVRYVHKNVVCRKYEEILSFNHLLCSFCVILCQCPAFS